MIFKTTISWRNQLTDKQGRRRCIFDLSLHPGGEKLVIAVESSIEVLSTADGRILHKLNAHKGDVHSLSHSRDGSYFASGSADKTVIIWSNDLEGRLKYSHSDAIQCVAYNPVSHQVLSCGVNDIGLWSPEHRTVARRKVPSRVCSCSWTNDGQYFALGFYNGSITIWTKNGDEKVKINRPTSDPVWCLSWNPSRDDHYNILSVCDWGQSLSFYQLSGKQIGKDHHLGYDPCSFSHSVSCDYYLIGGSNKQVLLYSREGVKLGALGDTFDSWVWSCQPHPNGNSIIVATYDGLITSYNVFFGTVHGLYKNRYACRAGLTDVVVQDLLTEDKFRLKCRDLVKKIAVYKDRLAVLVSEHVIMYESVTEEDSGDLTYIVKEKLPYNFQCSLLICCSENIVFCHDKQLRSLSLKGHIEMEWDLSSPVRYLKVLGGLPRKEAMLVALHNGQVLKIFLGNPFPISLCKINGVIRCVDLNLSQTKLAAVDESNVLLVYDLKRSGNLLYQEPNTTSVAWNIYFEDMLCYISKSLLYIKASNYPPQQHRLINGQGLVVGFIGSKIFSLHSNLIITTYVPQSNPMMQYLEQGLYSDSYNVACLGVTQSDWITLSLRSLEGMNLEVAKKGFCRVRDMKYIELINEIQENWSGNENDKKVHLGEIFAYENKFEEAVKMFCESNRTDKAVELYMELCEFDLAKQLLSEEKKEKKEDVVPSVNVTELVTREANWARSTNDPDRACESYLLARDYKKAIAVMSENRWVQKLINLSVKLTADDADALKLCAHELKRLNEHELAANIYIKLEDYPSLVTLYADTQQWDEGIALVNSNPDLKDLLYLPYGLFLMESDKFEEAQEALRKAGKQSESLNLLRQLCDNSISMNNFRDASYYNWLLAKAYLEEAKNGTDDNMIIDYVEKFHWHLKISEIYYVYQHIYSFIKLPFTSQQSETMFNMASFLLREMAQYTPPGISIVYTYLTLGKHGANIEAYKTAHFAYEKLLINTITPPEITDFIENSFLTLKAKPLYDKEDLHRFCYRCSTTNPIISSCGNYCTSCCHPFIYSLASFDVLPLVEFFLEEDISDEEALALIRQESSAVTNTSEEIIKMDQSDLNGDDFAQLLLDDNKQSKVVINREILQSMHWKSVIIKKWPPPLRYQYFCSVLPNVHISLCPSCQHMFYIEEYELQVKCKGKCPFCRQPSKS